MKAESAILEIKRIHPEDIDSLARAFAEALQQARSVSDSEHFDHHKWITARIEKEGARRLFWDEMTKHVVKWGVIGVVSGLLYALYLGIRISLKLPV